MKKLILVVTVVFIGFTVQAQSSFHSKSPKAIKSSIGEFETESSEELPQRAYTVKISRTKDGGTSTLLKFNQPENPVTAPSIKSEIKIFPNPASSKLHITVQPATTEKINLKIFNVLGIMVKSLELDGTETEIDISDLQQGTYFLRCCTETGVETSRFIKE